MSKFFRRSVAFVGLLLIVLCMALSGCSVETVDDKEGRTYRGTVYDVAYGKSQKDGLRAKAYTYFLFNTTENTFVKYVHTTAGSGKTTVTTGTYAGSFEDSVITTFTRNGETFEVVYIFKDNYMYSEDGTKSYPAISVETAIRNMR